MKTSTQNTRLFAFAQMVSIVLIPPTAATAVFTILVCTHEQGGMGHLTATWLTAILFSGVLQIGYVLVLRRQQKVTAYDVPNRLQRTKPYYISAGLSAVGLVILLLLDANPAVWGLMWCFAVNTLILNWINSKWKISAHMMGLTGPLTYLYPLLGWNLLYALPLVLLLGWARIETRSHTPAQVLAGSVAGILLTVVQMEFLTGILIPALI